MISYAYTTGKLIPNKTLPFKKYELKNAYLKNYYNVGNNKYEKETLDEKAAPYKYGENETSLLIAAIITFPLVLPLLCLFVYGGYRFYKWREQEEAKSLIRQADAYLSNEGKLFAKSSGEEGTAFKETAESTGQAIIQAPEGGQVVIHNQKETLFEEENTFNPNAGSYYRNRSMKVIDVSSQQTDIQIQEELAAFDGTNGMIGTVRVSSYTQNSHIPAQLSFWKKISDGIDGITRLISPSPTINQPAALPSTISSNKQV